MTNSIITRAASGELASFVFYESVYDTIRQIRDESARLAVLDAVIRFGMFGEITEFTDAQDPTGIMNMAYTTCATSIAIAQRNRTTASDSGRRGGRPRKVTKSETDAAPEAETETVQDDEAAPEAETETEPKPVKEAKPNTAKKSKKPANQPNVTPPPTAEPRPFVYKGGAA